MKRSLQLGALVAVLTLSLIAGTSRPVYALPACNTVHGTACSPNGINKSCQDGPWVSNCICTFSHWVCQK
jgi:hypothetical protein